MTEPILSPAEEADAAVLLAGLAEPVGQYAGLTPLEAAAAATSAHMSTCLRPLRLECVDCSEELHVIRRYLVAVEMLIEAAVLREAARQLEEQYPTDIWLPDSDSPDAMAAKGVRVAAGQLRHMADWRDPAVPDDGSYPDGAPVAADLGQERSEEQR